MNNLKWNIWDAIIIGSIFVGAILMMLFWGCIATNETTTTFRIGAKQTTVTNYVWMTNWVTNYTHGGGR